MEGVWSNTLWTFFEFLPPSFSVVLFFIWNTVGFVSFSLLVPSCWLIFLNMLGINGLPYVKTKQKKVLLREVSLPPMSIPPIPSYPCRFLTDLVILSFCRDEQTCIYLPSVLDKRWHTIFTLLQFAFSLHSISCKPLLRSYRARLCSFLSSMVLPVCVPLFVHLISYGWTFR